MSRTLALLFALVLLPLAGCIAPFDVEEAEAAAFVPPAPEDRIDGMTATETKQDTVARCENGGISVPARTWCGERDLLVQGLIGLDALDIDLRSVNGEITLLAGPADVWSFHAVVKVAAATEEEARDGLDKAWMWNHTDGERHFLKAGPTPTSDLAGLPLLEPGSRAQVTSTKYEVTMPSWILLDIQARTSNGEISAIGLRAGTLALETTNGEIDVAGVADDADLRTTNGEISAALTAAKSGRYALHTSNGEIDLIVPETFAHGYDLEAHTSNGRIDIELVDGELTTRERNEAAFRTHGFDARAIQTVVKLATSNGAITVAS